MRCCKHCNPHKWIFLCLKYEFRLMIRNNIYGKFSGTLANYTDFCIYRNFSLRNFIVNFVLKNGLFNTFTFIPERIFLTNYPKLIIFVELNFSLSKWLLSTPDFLLISSCWRKPASTGKGGGVGQSLNERAKKFESGRVEGDTFGMFGIIWYSLKLPIIQKGWTFPYKLWGNILFLSYERRLMGLRVCKKKMKCYF